MALATGAGQRLAYIPEVTWGTTPATPALKLMRVTGGGFRLGKATGTSDEIRADRNVTDEFLLGVDPTGTFPFEMTYGSMDDLIEGALFSTWTTNVIKNGVTRKSFTFEQTLELGVTDSFRRITGSMVNTLSLEITAREKVTGTIEVFGKDEQIDDAIVTGATYVAANTNPVSTASAHVASLVIPEGGSAPIRTLSIQIDNGLRRRPVVSSIYSEEFGEGRCEVTGSLEAYVNGNTLYEAVLDHGGGALSFNVGNSTGLIYTFSLPQVIFGDGEITSAGNNDDVMLRIPFRAVYNSGIAATIQITRAVA